MIVNPACFCIKATVLSVFRDRIIIPLFYLIDNVTFNINPAIIIAIGARKSDLKFAGSIVIGAVSEC